jgi:curli biogenesis system outer membrane secretion channel CsgG
MMLSRKVAAVVAALTVFTAFATAAPHTLKMRIAVAPLDWSDHDAIDNYQIPVEFRNAIYEKLVKKLMDTGKYIVLEREAMEALLTEKDIKTDNTGQSQKGKIVPAQALIKAKLTDFDLNNRSTGGSLGIGGSLGGISLGGRTSEARVGMNVRIFDVDTSEMIADESADKSVSSHSVSVSGNINSVFASVDSFDRTPLGDATTKAISEAVDKISASLDHQPWSASVADWDATAKEVTINAGGEVGVEVGDTYDVYRVTKVIKDPETGAILGKKTSRIGSIRITSVEKKFAVASPVEGTDFTIGDVVKAIK